MIESMICWVGNVNTPVKRHSPDHGKMEIFGVRAQILSNRLLAEKNLHAACHGNSKYAPPAHDSDSRL